MKSVFILPTGNEIKNGTVVDLDSPEIMKQVVCAYPCAQVTRLCPIVDKEEAILNKIDEIVSSCPDLIILIGGSGEGHRYSNILGKDFTHSALEKYLEEHASYKIYGKNGHMWSKLICGKKDQTMIINVPGPFVEAQAACEAFLKAVQENKTIDSICFEVARAVYTKYPKGAAKEPCNTSLNV